MRLAGQTWSVRTHAVRLGPREYRVVRPERSIGHAVLHEGRLGAQLSVDAAAATTLALAWGLAARSPRSLIFLPLRSMAEPCETFGDERHLDLVLLHHSLQFPASRWRQLRARLGTGQPHRVSLPPWAFRPRPAGEHLRRHRQGHLDDLRWTIAADTLFVVGSRDAFDLQADLLRGLAEDCPAHVAREPETHCCAEVDLGRPRSSDPARRNGWIELHVERCTCHR